MSPNPAFWKRNGRAHCGTDIEGGYLYTLTLTDVATGWTECLSLLYRSQETVLAALQQARLLFPFPILGIDTDTSYFPWRGASRCATHRRRAETQLLHRVRYSTIWENNEQGGTNRKRAFEQRMYGRRP
jgi:hypothetical protein